jgi:hypothetical protein
MIVRESINFQRGMSDREIRDTLIGWGPGQFLINPHTDIVYIFIDDADYANTDVHLQSVGHILRKKTQGNPTGKIYFTLYDRSKRPFNIASGESYRPKNQVRPLANKEWGIIKPYLTPEYINKLELEVNLKLLIP